MLIAIEGIDGAGKRTQVDLLKSRLEGIGCSTGMLSFPRYGETLMAGTIADYLNGKFGDLNATPPEFGALLYAGDRLESRDLLMSMLEEWDVVLADRYVASNAAYQSAKLLPEERGAFLEWQTRLEYEVHRLPEADVTLFLDIPVQLSQQLVRKKAPRGYTDAAQDLHEENAQYLENCRTVYQGLIGAQHRSRWLSIDCTSGEGLLLSKRQIQTAIWSALAPFVKPEG